MPRPPERGRGPLGHSNRYRMVDIFLTLSLIWAIHAHDYDIHSDLETKPIAPVTFQPLGELILSGNSYVLPLTLDINDLLTLITPIKETLLQVRDSYHKTFGRLNSYSHATSHLLRATSQLPHSIQSHISLLLNDLESRIHSVNYMLFNLGNYNKDNSPYPRVRRAPLEFVGTLAHALFGLVDADEFADTKHLLQSLSDLSERERQSLNLHSKILNITAMHIESLTQNQDKVMNALNTVKDHIHTLNVTLFYDSSAVYDLTNTVSFISVIGYCSSSITDLDLYIRQLEMGLTKMLKGELVPSIYPPEKLSAIIESISLSNLRPLWPPTEQYLALYYKFARVTPISGDQFIFLVQLPLLSEPHMQLRLYKVTALPYPIDANITITYGTLLPYFAITNDLEYYMEVDNKFIQTCRTSSSLYYCQEALVLYKKSAPSCLYSLYVKADQDKHCVKHVAPKLDRPLIQYSAYGTWYYASNQPLTLVATCPTHTKNLHLPLGVGAIRIPSKCRVNSDMMLLPTVQSIRHSPEHINLTHIIQFNVTLNTVERNLLGKFNDTTYKDLLALNKAPIPLAALVNDLGQLHLIKSTHVYTTVTSSYAAVLGTALLILLVCLLCAVWYMKR